MTAIDFNTENRTYRQLLGNGLTYRVPPFQRDYSWGEPEWEDLWADILGTLPEQGEPAHSMGYLVLQTNDNRSFEVIDSQPRLTTAGVRLESRLAEENADWDPERLEARQAQLARHATAVWRVERLS